MTNLVRAVTATMLLGLIAAARGQNPQAIPVYPGARLSDAEECCEFTTQDPLSKVLAFYGAQLRTPALTAQEYGARNPAMRARVQQLQQTMPPSVQYRVFVLGDGATFEVLASPEGTRFSITEEQLGVSGAQWGHEFRKKTNQMTDPDREYVSWWEQHPLARQEDFGLPVYPGALLDATSGERVGPRCYEVYLLSTDPYAKVVAFYQQKLLGQLKAHVDNGTPGEPYQFGDERWENITGGEEGQEVRGRRGDVNRYVDVEPAAQQLPGFPYFSAEQREVVRGSPGADLVGVHLKTQELAESCGVDPNAKWLSGPPKPSTTYTKEATYGGLPR